MSGMEKSIRVRILEREFGLRIHHDSEEDTRKIATYVDDRMRAFRRVHPEQPELTAAIITALAIAEELFTTRELHEEYVSTARGDLESLAQELDDVLGPVDFHGAPNGAPESGNLAR